MQVAFEEREMEVMLRNGERQKRYISTPVFRLSDGTEFTGRFSTPELRTRIFRAANPKGIK